MNHTNSFDEQMNLIVEALDAFEALLTPVRPIDLGALIQGRIKLSRAVAQFLNSEWAALPHHLASDEGKSRHEVDAIHRAFVSLRVDYSRHVADWDSAHLVKDWSGYRAGCQHLIRSMRKLVDMRAGSRPSSEPKPLLAGSAYSNSKSFILTAGGGA